MIETKVPMDIRKYKSKFIGPFTTRQLICGIIAGCLDIVLYFLIVEPLGISLRPAIFLLVLVDCPILAFTIEPLGMPMETYLTSYGEASTADTPTLYGILSDTGQSFFLTEDCLTIYEVADHKLSSRQYHVTCPPKWSRITTGPPRTGSAETEDSRK